MILQPIYILALTSVSGAVRMNGNTMVILAPGILSKNANMTNETGTWSEVTLSPLSPFKDVTPFNHSVRPREPPGAFVSGLTSASFLNSSHEMPKLGSGKLELVADGHRLTTASRRVCKLNTRKKLGKGSFGSVYACGDDAVKFITDKKHVQECQNEFRMQNRVNSPHVVKVKEEFLLYSDDSHFPNGTLCIVMERLGKNLRVYMNEGLFKGNVERTKRIFRQVLQGVVDTHGSGVIFRDLKPGNILCTESGPDTMDVKLCDFGLAAERGVVHTDPVGSWGFMAPEEISGNHSHGEAADAWELGILLYEMYFDTNPFEAPSNNLLMQIQNIETKQVEFTRDEDVSEAPFQLKDLIRKCLDKDPTSRLLALSEDPRRRISNHPWLRMDAQSAAEAEAKKMTVWLEENGFDNVSHRRQEDGKTSCPLHTAVTRMDVEIVEILLKQGSNTECKDEKRSTPRQLATTLFSINKGTDKALAYDEIIGYFDREGK